MIIASSMFYQYFVPDGTKYSSINQCLYALNYFRPHCAFRHNKSVELTVVWFFPSRPGRYMIIASSMFYQYFAPDGTKYSSINQCLYALNYFRPHCAVRHNRSVELTVVWFFPSRPGRYMIIASSMFYQYFVPDGTKYSSINQCLYALNYFRPHCAFRHNRLVEETIIPKICRPVRDGTFK